MADGKRNLFPSKAHYDNRGRYVHDPINQPLAEHEKLGNLQPRDLGQLRHVTAVQGYCKAHVKLGCEVCTE
jgi:hypothetical protein